MHDWVNVAELVKPKSLQGGLVARCAPGLPFLLRVGLEVAFVPPALDAPRRGVVVEAQEQAGGSYLVSFDAVDSIDTAEALAGCSCLARRCDLPVGFDEQVDEDIVGYAVVDEVVGQVGEVVDVVDNGAQQLVVVDGAFGEVLIPFVDAIVLSIDDERKTVATRMPSGLLDC